MSLFLLFCNKIDSNINPFYYWSPSSTSSLFILLTFFFLLSFPPLSCTWSIFLHFNIYHCFLDPQLSPVNAVTSLINILLPSFIIVCLFSTSLSLFWHFLLTFLEKQSSVDYLLQAQIKIFWTINVHDDYMHSFFLLELALN